MNIADCMASFSCLPCLSFTVMTTAFGLPIPTRVVQLFSRLNYIVHWLTIDAPAAHKYISSYLNRQEVKHHIWTVSPVSKQREIPPTTRRIFISSVRPVNCRPVVVNTPEFFPNW